MIILFFGQPASGKTTLANALVNNWGASKSVPILIDGDAWRDITKNKDYSRAGRLSNLKGAFDMALYLEKSGFVVPIVSFVTPYEELRSYLRSSSQELIEIYLKYSGDRGRNSYFATDFEEPHSYNLCLDTSLIPIEECVTKVKMFIG